MGPHVLLASMEAARHQTRWHLELIDRQIASRAERQTVTRKAKARSHRRGRSNWTRSDERMYLDHLDSLLFERRGAIAALSRKLARQDQALAAFRKTLGVDTDGEVW